MKQKIKQPGQEIARIYPRKIMKSYQIGTFILIIVWFLLFYYLTSVDFPLRGTLPKILYYVIIIGGIIFILLFINSLFYLPIILYRNGIQPMGTKLLYWYFNLENKFIHFDNIKYIKEHRYIKKYRYLEYDRKISGIRFRMRLINGDQLVQRVDEKVQFDLVLKTFKKFKAQDTKNL